jgi:hypothetical protein
MQAQVVYEINEYGTYIIDYDTSVIQKTPVDCDLYFYKFYRNYAILFFIERNGMIVYDISHDILSENIFESYSAELKVLEGEEYFSIFVYNHIYKFNPLNLEVIEKTYVGELYRYPETDSVGFENLVSEKRTGERTILYESKNNSIEVIYSDEIGSLKNKIITVYDSISNRYVIHVYKYYSWDR